MKTLLRCAAAAVALAWASAAWADDTFFEIPLGSLKLTEGTLPRIAERGIWRFERFVEDFYPRVTLDGDGEAYVRRSELRFGARPAGETIPPDSLLVRSSGRGDVSGTLFMPAEKEPGMVRLRFVVPADKADAKARERFFQTKQAYYEHLTEQNLPGTAWFRYQARQAALAIRKQSKPQSRPGADAWRNDPELVRTYDLFTGSRAVSENLQLDRALPQPGPNEKLVQIASVPGITVAEFDWKPLLKDLRPKADALAPLLPADQHAVFFPSFQAAVDVMDQISQQGTVLLGLADPRSEDTGLVERYERQLGVAIHGLGRLLGPHLVRSMAVTGSDANFPSGTDVAILLETAQPEPLAELIWTQVSLTAKLATTEPPGKGTVPFSLRRKLGQSPAEEKHAVIDGLSYRSMVAADRSISSYVAVLDKGVVVTNSLYQLKQLAGVKRGTIASLVSTPEYKFFRDRYRCGEENESALLMLTDATIRRWCGPRWRIGDSRRTRAAALLAELQAAQMQRLVQGKIQPGPIYTDLPTFDVGDVQLTAAGVVSSKVGSLRFMTPIAEMSMDEVLQGEVDSYARWRDTYQRYWGVGFDPIAARLSLTPKGLAGDLTVMPLILNTEYRTMVAVVGDAKIAPQAGDPHGALAHLAVAIDRKSPLFHEANNMAQMMLSGAKFDPLGWLGSSLAVYVDDDPFWQKLAKMPVEEREKNLEHYAGELPVALVAEVSSGMRLTAFLAGLRGMVEQSAPGMVTWEALTYKDQPYVKVTPTELGKTETGPVGDLAIYYAPSGEQLVVTLQESVLKRSLDRRIARQKAKAEGQPAPAVGPAWLGESAALQVDHRIADMLEVLFRDQYQKMAQGRAWSNLPILNQWKQQFPAQDPLDIQQRFWQTRLVCPGGGRYVWNEKWQTYESTVYGHPGEPKKGPATPPRLVEFQTANFGVTFEHNGLRARAVLGR